MASSGLQDSRTDQQLIAAINAGDTEAFEALYRRYRDWSVSLAYRFAHDRDAALDVMQEAFIYLLRQFPGFELTARFTTFFYPVVRHLAHQRQRKVQRETAPLTHAAEPFASDDDPPDEAREALDALLAEMPEAQREAIVLRFVEGMSIEDIAAAMEVPPGTVKSRLHHGLRRLREDPRTKNFFFN